VSDPPAVFRVKPVVRIAYGLDAWRDGLCGQVKNLGILRSVENSPRSPAESEDFRIR
jgi:hypothetical protein